MKLRILEVLPTLRRAGAENVVLALALGLPRDQFETGVVSLYDPFGEGLEPELAQGDVNVWHLNKRCGFDLRMWPRLRQVFREFSPNVIHTHSYVLRYTLPVAGPVRQIHTLHNMAGKDPDELTAMLNRVAFRLGVRPVAVSATVARSFEERYGHPPAATIPNGVDLSRFRGTGVRANWRAANGYSNEDVLIVSVARLEPQKDPETLIRAFATVQSKRSYLLLAGHGSLRDAARGWARDCGVDDRVHFLGVRENVPEVLGASDIFSLASRWEGRPVSVMEAMAAGLPVVATSVGGVPELVEDQISGVLVQPGDVTALGSALAALIGDTQRRRAMGEAARTKAQIFSVEAMVADYAELFLCLARRTT